MLYACDHVWWQHYFRDVAAAFQGELWTVSEGAAKEFDLRWILGHDSQGAPTTPDYITTGRNSGHQALALAYVFGARRVILLGYDFAVGDKGEIHWHGRHPDKLSNSGPERFGVWAKIMEHLARDLARANVRVLNASRRTALRCFPRVTLETALHEI